MRLAVLALSVCLLAGCDQQAGEADTSETAISAADQAKADEVLAAYEAARAVENWEGAEASAALLEDKYPSAGAIAKLAPSVAQVRERAEQSRQQRRLRDLWEYQAIPAAGGTQRSAALDSFTVPVGEDEAAPRPDAQLILRDHPEWGASVYLLLAQSRFKCGSPCAMQVAFDDQPAERFAGKQADSGKGPALFIEEDKRFTKAMETAGKVRIRLPEGSGTVKTLVFEVGGYQPSRYAAPNGVKP